MAKKKVIAKKVPKKGAKKRATKAAPMAEKRDGSAEPWEPRDAKGRTNREFECQLSQRIADAIAATFGPSNPVGGKWTRKSEISADVQLLIESHIRACFNWLPSPLQSKLDVAFHVKPKGMRLILNGLPAEKYAARWERIFASMGEVEREFLGANAAPDFRHTTQIAQFIQAQRNMMDITTAFEKGNACISADGRHGIWLPARRKRSEDNPLAIRALAVRVHAALPESLSNRPKRVNELLQRLGLVKAESTEQLMRTNLANWEADLSDAEEHARKQRGEA